MLNNVLILLCSYISMNMETLRTKEVIGEGSWKNTILRLTDKCSNEPDINKKINLLYKINSVLPVPYQVKFRR